jgi:hypothetical protein
LPEQLLDFWERVFMASEMFSLPNEDHLWESAIKCVVSVAI